MSASHEASPYDGPVHTVTYWAGGRAIQLVQPVDPDRLLEAPEVAAWNQAEDYMPYWAYLWPGSFLLCDAVVAGQFAPGTRTLELGCGLGLPGLVALSVGLRVEFTDHDRTPLGFVARSIMANGFDPELYSVALLDWRQPTPGRFALILGADITYERRLVPLVAGVIAAKLAHDGVALITDPDRVACAGFTAAVRALGLEIDGQPATGDANDLGPARGTIYRIWWPGNRRINEATDRTRIKSETPGG